MPHLSYEALSVLARSGPASKNTSKSSGIGSGSNGSSEKSRVYIDSANAPSLLSVRFSCPFPPLRITNYPRTFLPTMKTTRYTCF